MDSLTVALASLGGVVLAGVIAHGAWQARRAGPKLPSGPREEPSATRRRRGPTSPVSRPSDAEPAPTIRRRWRRDGSRSARRCSSTR